VVVSDEVGAAEGVSPDCCTVFPAGDANAFELAVRELVDRLERGEANRGVARSEAIRLFDPEVVAESLAEILRSVAGGTPVASSEAMVVG
jgi:glycosyltransferase involved in cell wall biosynthesis